jgi:pimeloyl-ACP methyl ester carboxylesterase
VLAKMLTPRRFRDPDYAASVAGHLYGGSARRHRGELHDVFDSQQVGGSARGYVYQLAAGAGWTSLPFLRMIRQPTLVLAGDDDPIVPAVNARLMARLLPHARLHVYHGGHVELITEPAGLASVVTGFLDSEPAGPRSPSRRTCPPESPAVAPRT